MRIAFVTTCLQPGRDGVGDHMACLAAECAALGHEVLLVALNDPFLEGNAIEPERVRLSAKIPWPIRWKSAEEALGRFAPDAISLHFVCYGFHPRGFCFGLGEKLKTLCGNAPVEITFHELWIGAELGARAKDRLIGAVQRSAVRSVLDRLRPALVHTTNPAYLALLARNKINARRLPLFGSIPVPETAPAPHPGEKTLWRFAMFGTLHPVWPPRPLLDLLLSSGKKIEIVHIGNMGKAAELWGGMERDFGDRIGFERLGELTPEAVSQAFCRADFGVATTPWELIGKSASVAAMIEHGLPVIVNRDDVHFRGWTEKGYSPQLIKMGPKLTQQLGQASRQPPRSMRAEIARQFLADLKGVL